MPATLETTLVTDGTSDRVLKPFIEYALDEHCPRPYVVRHASDLPAGALAPRLVEALRLYPCDVLFVHRDAERQGVPQREAEIVQAIQAASLAHVRHVAVVPVRMTESWLLLDERAIRSAAGNPNGSVTLSLPPVGRVESVDAKETLFAALEAATELGARRIRGFDRARARQRVADYMPDFSRLRDLPSFRHFEQQVRTLFAEGPDSI